jgi:mono/diheme cytochrome c family protein
MRPINGVSGLQRLAGVAVLALGWQLAALPVLLAQPLHTAAPVSFATDVAPIFQQKCQECHRPDSMAPMSLLTYEEARPWARSIKARVVAREMPPWFLDKTIGIQQFINDISLTDEEIDTIVRWVDSGAPAGDLARMPPPREWPSGDRFRLEERLGPPDHVIAFEPFTMPAVAQDTFVRPIADVGLTEPRWVKAAETKPSGRQGRRIAHHASTYLHQSENAAFLEAEQGLWRGQATADVVLDVSRQRIGGDPIDTREMFTEWAQGKSGEIYPEGTGKLVKPGARFEVQIHYHAVGEEITDRLELGLWFYPVGVTPRYSVTYISVGTQNNKPLHIPPHTATVHQGSYTLPAPAILHNFQPHMHYRGSAFSMEALYPDGQRELLNHADRFSNDWHVSYIYDPDHAPLLPRGTVLQITAWHDNTAANRNNPDPRQWVAYGPRTVDEMAHSNSQIIFITEEDYERMSAERQGRTRSSVRD